MKVKTISYSRALTINLGNFESCRVDWSMSAEVEDTDDLAAAVAELRVLVQAEVKAERVAIKQMLKLRREKEQAKREAEAREAAELEKLERSEALSDD